MYNLLNNVTATLAAAIDTDDVTVTVDAGEGAQFASASAENPIRATLVQMSGQEEVGWEQVDVTARSTDDLTVTRNIEATGALSFAIGDKIEARWTQELPRIIVAEHDQNALIATDFTKNPWQRGTTFTALASAGYGPDRFIVVHSSDAVVDILKTADAPTVAQTGGYFTQHCLHADVTTADAAIGAGQYYIIQQRIEGLNAARYGFGQAGTRNITIPFWVKSTKTGIYCVAVVNSAGDRSYVAEYTVNAADTWEFKCVTIPVDTTGTWLYTTGIGIRLSWALACGSTFQTAAGAWAAGLYYGSANQVNSLDSASNNFKIALPDFYQGSTWRPYRSQREDEIVAACQRYYEKSFNLSVAPAQNSGTLVGALQFYAGAVSGNVNVQFAVSKRDTPTVTTYNYAATNANWRDAGAAADRAASLICQGDRGFSVYSSAFVIGNANYIHWSAAAEL